MNNDYYDIAINDAEYLKITLGSKHYNNIAVNCQQIVEKLLKSVAMNAITDSKLMNSHNLRALYRALLDVNINLRLSMAELIVLKDYFEARNPGDTFIDVTRDECVQCIDTVNATLRAVNAYRNDLGLVTKDMELKLNDEGLDLRAIALEQGLREDQIDSWIDTLPTSIKYLSRDEIAATVNAFKIFRD